MSKAYDKRPAIRLEPETVQALKEIAKRLPYKSSTPKIVNEATRLGLPMLLKK